jgi:hypothetical protein
MDQEDWWAITSIHEAAHGIAAYALTNREIILTLNRRSKSGDTSAGECLSRVENSWYGEVAHIFIKNAPFVAHQYEVTPCGNKGDLHERADAFTAFCKLIGTRDEALFRKCVDEPLLRFFGSSDVQAAVLVLARRLFASNRVVIKQSAFWRKLLDVPDNVYNHLEESVTAVATAIAGDQ